MGELIEIAAKGGSFQAFLSLPAAGTGPGVVVLPEIYNVNDWVRAVCDLYSEAGYVALAPDVFWRHEPHLYMAYNPENQQRGRKLATELDTELALDDLDTCYSFLRKSSHTNGKAGVVGYCLGGQLAYLSAARRSPDGSSVYYGTRIQHHVHEARNIRCPTDLHFGELDQSVPVAAAAEIEAVTRDMPHVSVYVYEQAPHAFGRFGHPPYRPGASGLALQRTHDLFSKALR